MYNILDNFVGVSDLKTFYDDYCLNGKIGWAYNNKANHQYPIDSFSSNKNTDELIKITFIKNCLNRTDTKIRRFAINCYSTKQRQTMVDTWKKR